MKRRIVLAATLVAAALLSTSVASAGTPVSHWAARRMAKRTPWHGKYYHTGWGSPVALVVPPTAAMQSHYSWGVGQTRTTPLWHQFRRDYPGPYSGGYGFYPTPRWPSSTDQSGVYYIRGPW